jgi:hypothetical protein
VFRFVAYWKCFNTITEDFSTSHGLQFSTDVNPAKSKTKCIAWLQELRPLARLILSGNELPWVDSLKHLGITISISVALRMPSKLPRTSKLIRNFILPASTLGSRFTSYTIRVTSKVLSGTCYIPFKKSRKCSISAGSPLLSTSVSSPSWSLSSSSSISALSTDPSLFSHPPEPPRR